MAALQSFSSLQSVCPSVEGWRGGTRSIDSCKLKLSTGNEVFMSSFHMRGITNASSYRPLRCVAAATQNVPTVSDTKSAFLSKYNRPIPSVYNNVIQELLVQQHLMRYNQTYKYDAVFGLGFVTVYDQLMDGYPGGAEKETIFKAHIEALKEDPEQYRHILPCLLILLEPRGLLQKPHPPFQFVVALAASGEVLITVIKLHGRSWGTYYELQSLRASFSEHKMPFPE